MDHQQDCRGHLKSIGGTTNRVWRTPCGTRLACPGNGPITLFNNNRQKYTAATSGESILKEAGTRRQRVPGGRLQTTDAERHEYWGIILETSRGWLELGDKKGTPGDKRGAPEDMRGTSGDKRGTPEDKRGRREASYRQQNQGETISEAPSWRLEGSDGYQEATDRKDPLEDYQEK